MDNKHKLFLASFVFFMSTTLVNAAIINNDSFTTDTSSGLDWLDLTETSGLTYGAVTSQFGVGGVYDGWRHATTTDLLGWFESFGADNSSANYYNAWSTGVNDVVSQVFPLWADTVCTTDNCRLGFIYSQHGPGSNIRTAQLNDETAINAFTGVDLSLTMDYINIGGFLGNLNFTGNHALVRDTTYTGGGSGGGSQVPEPSILALMGLGLAGLGFTRRRKLQS